MKKLLCCLLLASSLTGCNENEDYLVTIVTELGEMHLLLYDETPRHKENFIKLAMEGFYDGTTFHRVIPNFMIQGGDPNSKDDNPHNDGQGGPGYTVPAEFDTNFTHVYGAVAAARLGDAQNPEKASSGSQFYIVEKKEGTHFLDQKYTVFGQVIRGLEVIDAIARRQRDARDRPLEDITMQVIVKKMKKKAIEKEYGYTYKKK